MICVTGLATITTRCTKQPSHVLLAAASLACATSFDDYCAILITGAALRPAAVAQRVPPLRFCWVLHAVGVVAPSLNPLSSWMGVQLGYLLQQVALLDGLAEQTSALSLLLATIPYRFYSVLMMLFLFMMLALPWARDFGTMRAALDSDAPPPQAQALQAPPARAQGVASVNPGRSVDLSVPLHDGLHINSDRRAPLADPDATADAATWSPHPLLRCFGSIAAAIAPADAPQRPNVPAAPAAPTPTMPIAGGHAAEDPATSAGDAAEVAEPGAEPEAEAHAVSLLGDAPPQMLYALVPFGCLLVGTPLGMYLDGSGKAPPGAGLLTCFAKADSTAALTWSTFFGCILAIALPLCRNERCSGLPRAALGTLMGAWVDGVREVTDCLVILLLAWALGALTHDLHTAQFLAAVLGAWLPAGLLPAAATLLSMLVSFGVGSAWGAMGILLPLVGPLVWELGPAESRFELLLCAFGGVMGGCVFGNVSSPLGDTAVLSAMVSRCDMMEHVGSQATYTALVAALALLLGALPVGLGVYPWWVALLLCTALFAAAPALAVMPASCMWARRGSGQPKQAAASAFVDASAQLLG